MSTMSLGAPFALFALLLVVPLVGLAFYEQARRRSRIAILAEDRLFARLAPHTSPGALLARRILQIAALAFVVVALASPRCGVETEILPRKGLDVVFAIDVSRSMRARDVLPDRLERAKAEVGLALEDLGDNRVALIAFAGTAFVQCPLTDDTEAFRSFLRALDPDVVPYQGSAIGAALEVARNLFVTELEAEPDAANAGRVLVVMSDGEDHEGNIDVAVQQLKELGVRVLVIGIGDSLGEPIPLRDNDGRTLGYKKDRAGETVMTRLDPEILRALAEALDGRYLEGKSFTDLGMSHVRETVAALEKREFEARVRRHDIDRARWPLGIALLLLLGAVLIPTRRGAR